MEFILLFMPILERIFFTQVKSFGNFNLLLRNDFSMSRPIDLVIIIDVLGPIYIYDYYQDGHIC